MITAIPNATAASPIPQAISLEPPIGRSFQSRRCARPGFLRRRGSAQFAVLRGLRTECQAVWYANAAKNEGERYRAEALVPRRQADWHTCSPPQHCARRARIIGGARSSPLVEST